MTAEQCGTTTPGLFDQLLGPCLNPPGHPKGTWHRDARGTEWREYEPAETTSDTPDWEHKGDGIWTLTVDGGTVLYTTRTTPEGRAQFAEEWAKGAKPEPDDDWAQQDDGTWTLAVKVGHHHSAAFRADESSTPQHRTRFARIAKAVSPILEEWPEHNRIDEHEQVVAEVTRAVLAALQQPTPASDTEDAK